MNDEFEDSVCRLASDIRRYAAGAAAPFVVALDGRSGAGKSTLAASLGRCLDALVLAGDDFYIGGVATRDDPPWVLAAACIDWRTMLRVLDALKTKGTAEFFAFDWAAFDGSKCAKPTIVHARDVIVIEGVYSARPQLRHLVDFTVLVDVSPHTRMERLRNREGELSSWELQWHGAEDFYFEHVVNRGEFDAVFDETEPSI